MEVPWGPIAKSLPVWAVAIAHFTNNWGYYTLLTCLPLYLKNILHFDMKSVRFIRITLKNFKQKESRAIGGRTARCH